LLYVDCSRGNGNLSEDFYLRGGLPSGSAGTTRRGSTEWRRPHREREIASVICGEAPNLEREVCRTMAAPVWKSWHRVHLGKPRRPQARLQACGGQLASSLHHRGRAVVFRIIEDFHERIDDEALDVDEAWCSCSRTFLPIGPRGYPPPPPPRMTRSRKMKLPPKLIRKAQGHGRLSMRV